MLFNPITWLLDLEMLSQFSGELLFQFLLVHSPLLLLYFL